VLIGRQGIGKSTLVNKLGGKWYSDNFGNLHNNKEAAEQIQGSWFMEVGELAGLKKAEVEDIKLFVARQVDIYRTPYAERIAQFPRQCIFVGTTNVDSPLMDHTGGRRFWIVNLMNGKPVKNLFTEFTEQLRNQVWAEAVEAYMDMEELHLSMEMENIAREIQYQHTEKDDRMDEVVRYLDMLLPENWEAMGIYERRSFIKGGELTTHGTKVRETITVGEIWCELFDRSIGDMSTHNTKPIHAILKSLKNWELNSNRAAFMRYKKQSIYVRKKGQITADNKK